ncbi:protein EMBRYO SAC DEVELOPMENT ARREST 3, chloroplastic-like isoform X2 [Quillaja saponaria]|uniref:Protein EMBRYO SAC DEVELOPMENT ARREST 3, chloroplastic-like isoform X2 n=1 Tax=Quillaja saponaria TaxID=32244 RepID=A0AAD7L156_QUISA|nr:protein EMBRYO SAC DEVELOPMENT ARREST 3, chloroplastic-like isoform X2 [Quillaja saponaria]
MDKMSACCSSFMAPALPTRRPLFCCPRIPRCSTERRESTVKNFAAKSGGFSFNSILKRCQTCEGKGAVECSGCKGTGKNKKNGNIFERWKCFDCQGFGLKSCPSCGQGGLTPEQRGER